MARSRVLTALREAAAGLGALAMLGAGAALVLARRRVPPGTAPGHEERDTNARAVVLVAAALVAGLAVSVVVVSWLFRAMTDVPMVIAPPEAGVASPATLPRIEQAPLLAEPIERRLAVEAAARARLQRWGLVEGESEIARIPIEAAMDLLAPPAAGAPPPEPVAADSASGRFVPGTAR